MAQVDYTLASTMLIAIMTADKGSTFALSVTDKKQSLGMIKEAILEGDADVVSAYLDNIYCPDREDFLALSADLQSGDELPDWVGKPDFMGAPNQESRHGDRVEVKINSADSIYVPSTRAPSVEQILKWRRNLNNIYGTTAHDALNSPLGGRHYIKNKRIYFTGHRAKIWLPQFSIDRATPKCQANARHTSLVVSRGVIKAHKEGYVSDGLFTRHLEISEKQLERIRTSRGGEQQ